MIDRVYLWIFGGLGGLITSAGGLLIKHISNSKKHPCKNDIVFRDVCESEKAGIRDCIEREIELSKERYETLTTTLIRLEGKIDKL